MSAVGQYSEVVTLKTSHDAPRATRTQTRPLQEPEDGVRSPSLRGNPQQEPHLHGPWLAGTRCVWSWVISPVSCTARDACSKQRRVRRATTAALLLVTGVMCVTAFSPLSPSELLALKTSLRCSFPYSPGLPLIFRGAFRKVDR